MNLFEKNKKIISSVLVVFLSILFVIEGLDKFLNILEKDWTVFLNPRFLLFPIAPTLVMKLAGVFEVLLGLSLWTRWRKWGSYLIALWLVAIAINLFSLHIYSIAWRDLVIALVAVLLARLSD